MINPRISSLKKSTTLKITALTKKLAREGKDVVNFAAGEPDFDTPEFIKQGAKRAIEEGFTKYTPSIGSLELREAIADRLKEEGRLRVSSGNIILTSGAKYAIFVSILALLDFGDEAIIPVPYWVSYPEMVKIVSGRVKFLPAKLSNNFKISAQDLKKNITSKTKLLILNYPNNPTGMTYSHKELCEIRDVLCERKIFVISDEIYSALIYDSRKHVSLASFREIAPLIITINGFSKTFSMTGWRVGYLAAHERIIEAVSKIIDHTTSCASSISQKAALAAIENKEWQSQIRTKFEKRRNLLWEGISNCSKLRPIKPEGTFYMFCDITGTGLSSLEFSNKLLEQHLVSCIPADVFGKEGFVRFSFATNSEQISKGVDRIKDFLKRH